jgi:hypothetical protein
MYYWKSYNSNFQDLKGLLSERALLQTQRKISDFDLIRQMVFVPGKLKLLLNMGLPKFKDDVKYAG